jgi:hypothetical protein
LAYSYQDILRSQFETLQADRAQANGELEAARLNEDAEGVNAAVERIYANDARMRSLNDAAMQMQRAQQAPQPAAGFGDDVREEHVELAQRYGLSPQQIGVAVNWTTDPHISDETKVKRYIENTHKLARMRQTGQYRDDQGTVKR